MFDNLPKAGDIIFTDRGLYKHFGIYIGLGRVIHFAAPKGKETDATNADICMASMQDFLKGDSLAILNLDEKYTPFAPEEIVKRAKSKLGTQKGLYSLVNNNCEHFAMWCRYGEKKSQQVDDVASVIVAVAGLPLAIISLFSSAKETYQIDTLNLQDIIAYFKEPKRLSLLQSNANYKCIVLKDTGQNTKYAVLCCIFDSEKNTIANNGDMQIFESDFLQEELQNAFADKNMIILQ